MTAIESLLIERASYVRRGLPDRVAQVDAVLASLGHLPPVESAVFAAPENAAIKRGPGRPRKEG